jgi:hypothetical protein
MISITRSYSSRGMLIVVYLPLRSPITPPCTVLDPALTDYTSDWA